MNIQHYLKRIKYNNGTSPTLETLYKLQEAHLLSVPFENLDIHNKVPIKISGSYEKVVNNNRGGFCYELNSIFYQLLKELGFNVKLISARVYKGNNHFAPEFDHMAIIAEIANEKYLADVGFGKFAFHPIKLELNIDQQDTSGIFRVEEYQNDYLLVKSKNEDGTYTPQYMFTEIERKPEDFSEMCRYHQTSPDSHFTQKPLCSIPTWGGRITLTGSTLIKTRSGEPPAEEQITTPARLTEILKTHFGIKGFVPLWNLD